MFVFQDIPVNAPLFGIPLLKQQDHRKNIVFVRIFSRDFGLSAETGVFTGLSPCLPNKSGCIRRVKTFLRKRLLTCGKGFFPCQDGYLWNYFPFFSML